MFSIGSQAPLIMSICPVLPNCICLNIEQVPVGILYLSLRELLTQEKRGMYDGQGEMLSDYTYMELEKACAKIAVVVARARNGAARKEVVDRGV